MSAMIHTSLSDISKHKHLNPGFGKAAEFLKKTDLKILGIGRHPVDGENVFLIIEKCAGKGREKAALEAHRRHIDIQFCVFGYDEIGIAPVSACRDITQEYNEEKDIMFFGERPAEWIRVDAKNCAIIFPEDAHAPLAAESVMIKGVFKVRV